MSNYLGYVYTGLCTDTPLPSEKKSGRDTLPDFFFWGEGFCTEAKLTKRLLEAIFKEDSRHIRHIVSSWIIFTNNKVCRTYLWKALQNCK